MEKLEKQAKKLLECLNSIAMIVNDVEVSEEC